mgnify:CR=1 FL=1
MMVGVGSVLNLEGGSFGELALASRGFAKDVLAVITGNHCLGVAEYDASAATALAFNIHEVGVGGLHQPLQFMVLLLSFM